MQIKLTRKSIAGAITVIISLTTLSVMYHGIRTGAGVIPGFSFLLWTLIALTYSTHEEITEYVKNNHTIVTEPMKSNIETMKTAIVETTRRGSIGRLSRRWKMTRNRIRQGLLTFLHHMIQALETPEDPNPPHNP